MLEHHRKWFGGVADMAIQLFNKIEKKKSFAKKICFTVFPTCYVKIHYFW